VLVRLIGWCGCSYSALAEGGDPGKNPAVVIVWLGLPNLQLRLLTIRKPSPVSIPQINHPPSLHPSRDISVHCALAAVPHTNTIHHGDYRRQGAPPLQSRIEKNYCSHLLHYRSSRSKMKWPRPKRTRPPPSIWVHIPIPRQQARARIYKTNHNNRSIEGQVGKAEERTPHPHIKWRWWWCRFRCR
jgi:hypothetical protein